MKCRLCKEDKVLIKKSHLIPDFLYKSLYDENDRLVKFDIIKMINGIKEKPSTPISSTYEQFVLCAKCDNEIISRYETYYAKNIFHSKNFTKKIFPEPTKINHYEYNNLDYNLTNIFFLTLLWRADLSDRVGFKDVKLSPIIEESIRTQILLGKYDENIVKITAVKLCENSNFNRSVTQFKTIENTYSLIIRDLIVFFHIKYDEIYNFMKNHGIDKNGKWIIAEIPKSIEGKFIMNYISPNKNL